MITIIDYNMGNLRSVQKAIEAVGGQTRISSVAEEILSADKVVLPGVGAMAPAMNRLNELNLITSIKKVVAQNRPFLGICLGMQLLFESSTEGGHTAGLGLVSGHVQRFDQTTVIDHAVLKVPHMGWNQVNVQPAGAALFNQVCSGDDVYFCHSYYCVPADPSVIASSTEYDVEFTSSISVDNIWAVQFHPEKSQSIGLQVLRNFAAL